MHCFRSPGSVERAPHCNAANRLNAKAEWEVVAGTLA
ncbi:hypothetical protein M2281_002451 [Mesorhizobium soli]|nr:hypothetical protein [Mesorhizobium soli]